jgi:hypothetical protein
MSLKAEQPHFLGVYRRLVYDALLLCMRCKTTDFRVVIIVIRRSTHQIHYALHTTTSFLFLLKYLMTMSNNWIY